jgi:hypothetical protein
MLPQSTILTQPQQVLSPTPVQSPQPVLPHAPQQKIAVARAPCFNYGRVGYFAQQCPKAKRAKASRVPASMVVQQKGQFRDPIPRSSHVNHTTVEDISESEEVLVGTFLLFGILSSSCLTLESRMTS